MDGDQSATAFSFCSLFWPYSFRLDADKEAEKSGVVEENVWNGTVTTETGGKFSVNL